MVGLAPGVIAPHLGGSEETTDPEPLPLPKQLGPYRILDLLGEGSVGIVYRAMGADRPEPIALKVLPHFLSSPHARSRFRQEVEALRRLDHPGIARIHDSGVLETDHGPIPYLAMELIDGQPLTRWAAQAGLNLSDRLRILIAICEALQHAHERGVIHRDLKPDNILVDRQSKPKILDFGIARITDGELRARTFVTGMGQLMGTLQYMSPEQAQAVPASIDARSDIYSLGVVAYELLSGKLPYEVPGDSIPRAIITIATAEPESLGKIDPALKGNIQDIIGKTLEKKPANRYATAAQVADDIGHHLAGKRIVPLTRRLDAPARRFLRRRGRAVAIAASLLAVLVVAGLQQDRTESTSDRSTPAALSRMRALVVRIDEAEQRLHRGIRTRDRVLEAISILERAKPAISQIEAEPYRHAMFRYVNFALGEAHYFLGVLDTSREQFSTAEAFWQEAAAVPFDANVLEDLDTMVLASKSIRDLSRHEPISCRGLAFEELAIYHAPLGNARQALHWRMEALAVFQGRDGPDYRSAVIKTQRGSADEPILLADVGTAHLAVGALTDSLNYLNDGIGYLSQAIVKQAQYNRGSAQASAFEHLGLAYMQRAQLTASTADLDSAGIWLGRSLEMRSNFGRPLIYLRTKRELATVDVWRGRLVGGDSSGRIGHLTTALTTLESALLLAISREEREETVATQVQTAEVHLDLAEITRDSEHVTRADSLLASAESLMDRNRFPIEYARLELVRGRWARVAWQLERNTAHRERAERALRMAASIVPETQHPHLHRLIREEAVRLADPPT